MTVNVLVLCANDKSIKNGKSMRIVDELKYFTNDRINKNRANFYYIGIDLNENSENSCKGTISKCLKNLRIKFDVIVNENCPIRNTVYAESTLMQIEESLLFAKKRSYFITPEFKFLINSIETEYFPDYYDTQISWNDFLEERGYILIHRDRPNMMTIFERARI